MRRFFLIRHGMSLANTRNLSLKEPYIFDGDIPLTDIGEKQACETGLFLQSYCKLNNIDLNDAVLWHSPFFRTEQTKNGVNKNLGIEKVQMDPRLSEMSFGLFDQRSPEDWCEIDANIQTYLNSLHSSFRGKFYAKNPNGESPFEVYNRISSFVETVYRDREANIFIVSHGITLRTFIMRMLHKDLGWYFNEPNSENCSVRLIEGEDGSLEDKGYIFVPRTK